MAADEVAKVTALNREHFSCRHADCWTWARSQHVLTTPTTLTKMQFRSAPKRGPLGLGAVAITKLLLTLSQYWAYNELQHISMGLFLFCLKASSAGLLLVWQKPFSRGKKLSRSQWIKIAQLALLTLVTSIIWLTGLSMCGPLRTVLVWEHSSVALLAVINTILACGSHPKSRGAALFILGIAALLLFDNDQFVLPSDHPEGSHTGAFMHFLFYIFSFLGVPDHKTGLVLLMVGVIMVVAQRRTHRKLAVDLGGSKRLQALVTAVQSVLLIPWVVFHLGSTLTTSSSSSDHPWSSSLSCLVVISVLLVAEFYIDSAVAQHEESASVALTSSVTAFITALAFSLTHRYLYPTDHHHAPSVGVVLATGLLLLSTITLTRPVRQSHGLLVGYSTSGLPLYSSQQPPPSLLDRLTPLFTKIIENKDSRRIFYFLVINLAFTGVEMAYGVWTNSLGLLSDGFHMLFDCTALLVGLYAAVLSHWKPTRLYSFGYSKVETLSGFVNGLFLIVIAVFVLTEALERLLEPPQISTDRLLVVSVAGFFVNLIGIAVFSHAHHGHAHHGHSHHGHSHNSNIKGLFLHVLADTLGSVGVIISSLLVEHLGWLIADPICSLFISALIVISVIPLLKETASALLLSSPDNDFLQHVLQKLPLLDGVLSYNDVHIWQNGEAMTGTLHVHVAPSVNEQKVAHMISQLLREHGVTLVAVQVEKEPFASSGQTVSYIRQYQQNTPPQVYVDVGPQAGEVKTV